VPSRLTIDHLEPVSAMWTYYCLTTYCPSSVQNDVWYDISSAFYPQLISLWETLLSSIIFCSEPIGV
jgi:hypothetical protein